MISKELNTYNYGKNILEELKNLYSDGNLVNEYEKLLNDYSSLVNRYEKILKISDKFEVNFFKENENLKSTLDYTLKKAQSKILDNITEHRKTKVAKSLYKEKIYLLEDEIDILIHQNQFLKNKLEFYISKYGDTDFVFSQKEIMEYLLKFSLNKKELENKKIDDILKQELLVHDELILVKLGITDFYKVVSNIKNMNDIENFILLISKFIRNSFHNSDIIFHHEYDEFYIIVEDRDIDSIKKTHKNMNSKRDIMGLDIKFTCSVITVNKVNINESIKISNELYTKASQLNERIVCNRTTL